MCRVREQGIAPEEIECISEEMEKKIAFTKTESGKLPQSLVVYRLLGQMCLSP